jgi:hypothetical protein
LAYNGPRLNESKGSEEKNYTYTIITTDSNKQLSFLHNRMPVILENGSDQIRLWLDPARSEWSKELQSLLKPYEGELECYPVSKEVGKVGNNSPAFIVPVASTDNKNNIANFFSPAKKAANGNETTDQTVADEAEAETKGTQTEPAQGEQRPTGGEHESSENHASLPVPASGPVKSIDLKRKHAGEHDDGMPSDSLARPGADTPPTTSPNKRPVKKTRSATTNGSEGRSIDASTGIKRITGYFHT